MERTFRGKSKTTLMCFPDVDECALGTDKCSVNALCSNSEGSYSCTCKLGYSGDGTDCDGK